MKIRQRKRRLMRTLAIIPSGARCPQCGFRGPHFVEASSFFGSGFWTCAKFYGSDGRRL